MEHKLYAGYARQVVEPTESIPLGGFSNELKRFHTAMTEDICITSVAGIFGVSSALEGYFMHGMKWYERVLGAVGGLLLIWIIKTLIGL